MAEAGAREDERILECDTCTVPQGKPQAYCLQCDAFICEECLTSHKVMRKFSFHTVSSLTDMKQDLAELINMCMCCTCVCVFFGSIFISELHRNLAMGCHHNFIALSSVNRFPSLNKVASTSATPTSMAFSVAREVELKLVQRIRHSAVTLGAKYYQVTKMYLARWARSFRRADVLLCFTSLSLWYPWFLG